MTTVSQTSSSTIGTKNTNVQNQTVQNSTNNFLNTGMSDDYFGSQCLWNNPNYMEAIQEEKSKAQTQGENQSDISGYKPTIEDMYLAHQIANNVAKKYSSQIPAMYSTNKFYTDDIFAQSLLTSYQNPVQNIQKTQDVHDVQDAQDIQTAEQNAEQKQVAQVEKPDAGSIDYNA